MRPSPERRAWTAAAILGLYLLVAFALFANVWVAPGSRWIGGRIDPPQAIWALAYTPHALAHGQNPLVSYDVNFPAGVNEMWNTSLVAPGVLLTPIALLLGPIVTYNLFVTVSVALSGFTTFLLGQRLGLSVVAAAVAGLLLELCPYLEAHEVAHPNLTCVALVPVLFLLLHELLVRQRWHWLLTGTLVGVVSAVQLMTSEEVFASSAVAATAVAGVAAILAPRREPAHLRHASACVGVGILLFAVLTAYPLAVQFFGPDRFTGILQPPSLFVADIANVAIPTHQLLSASVGWPVNPYEMNEYLGIPMLVALGIAAVWLRRQLAVRVILVASLVMFLLALGPALHVGGTPHSLPLPWSVIDHVPLLQDMLPVRLMLYVDLGAALVLGMLLERLWRARPGLRFMAVAIGAVTVFSWLPSLPREASNADIPAFFTSGDLSRVPEGTPVLVVPWISGPPDNSPMAWHAAADFRYRMPDGYFYGPDDDGRAMYGARASDLSRTLLAIENGKSEPQLTPALRRSIVDYLRTRRVRAVILGPMNHAQEAEQFLEWLLGPVQARPGGVAAWWTVPQA